MAEKRNLGPSTYDSESKTLQELIDEYNKKQLAKQLPVTKPVNPEGNRYNMMTAAYEKQLKEAQNTRVSPQDKPTNQPPSELANQAAGLGKMGLDASQDQTDPKAGAGIGAGSGALMMAPSGPVGMAVGAAVGGLIGGLSAKSKQKAAKKLAEAQEKARQGAIRERETANINTGLTNILEAFRSSLR